MIELGIEFAFRYLDTPILLCKSIEGSNLLIFSPKTKNTGEENESDKEFVPN